MTLGLLTWFCSLPFYGQVTNGVDRDRGRIDFFCTLRRLKGELCGVDLGRCVPVSELQGVFWRARNSLGGYYISQWERFIAGRYPQLPIHIRSAKSKLVHRDPVDEGHPNMVSAGNVRR